ncbi:MAG: SH3-like domain-containing protein [Pseudomonadota bacterium]
MSDTDASLSAVALAEIATPPVAPPYPVDHHRFQPGDRVRVRNGRAPGHIRTPFYVRGCIGRVERICGAFADPQELAYHRPGLPALPLYRVRFTMAAIWGARAEAPGDTVDVELYETWLEEVVDAA